MGLIARSRNHHSVGAGRSAQGGLESFNLDGVQIARLRLRRRAWPVRQVLLFLLAVIAFKVFLFFDMGRAAYGAKIEELSQGAVLERVASRAMRLDPLSKWFVDGVHYGRW